MRSFLPVLYILLPVAANAQMFQGNLAGVVTDASYGAVPAATVKLESPANGLKRVTVSTTSGVYRFAELPVGIYTLTVTAKGFQEKKVDNIEIAVSRTTDLLVQVEVSQVSSSVEVSASQVALDSASSAQVALVDSKIVSDIPINGRDYRRMFLLAPGVAGVNSPNNPSVNGARTEETNYQIDGVDDNDGKNIAFNQGLGSMYLPIEAIDQLSVQSNAESDMGRNSGASVSVVIKSGANTMHGALYEFNRNEALAAYSPLQAAGTRTPITERILTEFRVEIFNLTNRTNWACEPVSTPQPHIGRASTLYPASDGGCGGRPNRVGSRIQERICQNSSTASVRSARSPVAFENSSIPSIAKTAA